MRCLPARLMVVAMAGSRLEPLILVYICTALFMFLSRGRFWAATFSRVPLSRVPDNAASTLGLNSAHRLETTPSCSRMAGSVVLGRPRSASPFTSPFRVLSKSNAVFSRLALLASTSMPLAMSSISLLIFWVSMRCLPARLMTVPISCLLMARQLVEKTSARMASRTRRKVPILFMTTSP